jgi:anti-anti-sigma regulatory factor
MVKFPTDHEHGWPGGRRAQIRFRRIEVRCIRVTPTTRVHVIRILNPKARTAQSVRELGRELEYLVWAHPGGNFVLALEEAAVVGSRVLGRLLIAQRLARSLQGRLVIVSPSPLRQILKNVQLDQAFEMRDDTCAAIDELSQRSSDAES